MTFSEILIPRRSGDGVETTYQKYKTARNPFLGVVQRLGYIAKEDQHHLSS